VNECKKPLPCGRGGRGETASRDEEVQIDPIKPMLKAHGTKCLNLEFDILLSSFTFKFNLRCYNESKAPMHCTCRELETLNARFKEAMVCGGAS
jgi:hypothetical protein